jgi:hypothetical protein
VIGPGIGYNAASESWQVMPTASRWTWRYQRKRAAFVVPLEKVQTLPGVLRLGVDPPAQLGQLAHQLLQPARDAGQGGRLLGLELLLDPAEPLGRARVIHADTLPLDGRATKRESCRGRLSRGVS